MTFTEKIIILGSGPAGYTAAIYAARANLKPILISGYMIGGQLTTTTDVDNWPSAVDGILGPELMENFKKHAERFNVRIITDYINSVDLTNPILKLTGDMGEYNADTLIIATGANPKYLGLESETKYLGKGVSSCATCDGFFYKGLDVCVIGGGNTAVEESIYLSRIVNKVYLIHRRQEFRAEKILQDKLYNLVDYGNIELILDTELLEVIGDEEAVSSVRLKNKITNSESSINVSGVFIAIGHSPNSQIFEGHLELSNGYIVTKGGSRGGATQTSIPSVFAAGDVQDRIYRQAITSSASGCMAALDAETYINGLNNG